MILPLDLDGYFIVGGVGLGAGTGAGMGDITFGPRWLFSCRGCRHRCRHRCGHGRHYLRTWMVILLWEVRVRATLPSDLDGYFVIGGVGAGDITF